MLAGLRKAARTFIRLGPDPAFPSAQIGSILLNHSKIRLLNPSNVVKMP